MARLFSKDKYNRQDPSSPCIWPVWIQVVATGAPSEHHPYCLRMGDSDTVRTAARYSSLDGLRGLAASVVVLHHCFLVSPQLAQALDSRGTDLIEPWVWWSTFTPVHLLWAGREAVYIFFILSGFVLTLPLLRAGRPSWRAYYPRRLVRIYFPAWGSILVALLLAEIYPRVVRPEFSWWLNLHDEEPVIARDAWLVLGAGQLNSPLWSLQWELVFSLLLPLYWLFANVLRRRWLLSVLLVFLVSGAAEMASSSGVVFLLMFGVGTMMATGRDALERWARRLPAWGWCGVFLAAAAFMSSDGLIPALSVGTSMATIGGALIVFAFIGCKSAITLGNNSFVHWLGTRSFSLYLVHEPIVVSTAFSMHATNPFQVVLFAVPLSLLAAEVFFRLVERPSLRLAGFVGKSIADRVRRSEEGSFA